MGRENRFIAEGTVVLRVALASKRFALESVLVLPSRLEGVRPLLEDLPPDVPVYCAEPAVMDAVAGFHLHRGVLAVGFKRPPETVGALLATLPTDALVLVLCGISNHDNAGALFRNAAAFGAGAVLLDATSCDPLYRKAIRVSVGAVLKLPWAQGGTGAELLAALDGAGFQSVALSPGAETLLSNVPRGPRVALWLGAEGPGLPPELMARMLGVRIPQAGGWDSLNVATAGAVALYHFSGAARS